MTGGYTHAPLNPRDEAERVIAEVLAPRAFATKHLDDQDRRNRRKALWHARRIVDALRQRGVKAG